MATSGLDPKQVLELIVRPAMAPLPPGMRTVAAEQLVMGTAAWESGGFRFIYQRPHGPALGLWQMEPTTFRWLRDQAFINDIKSYHVFVREMLRKHASRSTPDESELVWNLRLAAAYARARYIPARGFPERDNVLDQAAYYKKNYNSVLGDAKIQDYERAWEMYLAPLDLWRGQ